MIMIGKYRLNTNVLLAPLAGCADLPFRLIMREHGAKFAFFEMVDANALKNNKKSLESLETDKKDRPIAAQLVGANPELMLSSARKLLKLVDVAFIDVNAACPVKKILKKKAGSYLIKDPKALYKVIKKLSSKLDVPVTVKLRSGYSRADHAAIAEIARNCEKNGASAIFIHGRTRDQGYSGEVDYEAIRAVKKAVKIPVFGSGNVLTPELAKRMFDETGCDGILVARGSFGNPWIFRNIEEHLKGRPVHTPDLEEKKKAALEHIGYINKYSSRPLRTIGLMRKAALWYMKGFSNAAQLRGRINTAKSYDELKGMITGAKER